MDGPHRGIGGGADLELKSGT